MKNSIKLILPILLATVLCFALIGLTGGFKEIKVSSYTGSGGILNEYNGLVYLKIDTSADTSGVVFHSGFMNTGNNNGTVQGWVQLDYNQDSSLFVDSFVLSLKTAMKNDNANLAWTLATDTFDSSFYKLYSYTGDDTLFKAETWWELNVWDSTSDTIGLNLDGTRVYKILSGFNTKE